MRFAHFGIRSAACMLVLAAFTFNSFGQKQLTLSGVKAAPVDLAAPNASVAPVVFDGDNIDCSDLNGLHQNGVGDIRFSHIISDWELKLNFADPNGSYPFTTGGGRIVVGTQYPSQSFTITSSSNPGLVSSWSSTLPVTAINVKVGNTSYVYPYKPFSFGDTNLATLDPRGISHITICYGEPTGPTAGEITVSGRVVDASGIGIAKAQLVLVNGSTGESKITMTNPFGYYAIPDLEVNHLYILNVNHKRFSFSESQRVITPGDNFSAPDFVANPF